MRVMRPKTVALANLVSSNVSEPNALYSAMTTYALDAIARVDQATGAVEYKSLANSNLGNPVTDASKWLALGPSNRWKALDGKIGAQTERAESTEHKFTVDGRIDGVSLLNLDGVSVQVIAEDAIDGVVFDYTASLVVNYGVVDIFAYLTEPIRRRADIDIRGIPPLYAGLTITVRVFSPGGTAKVGEIIPSLSQKIGGTQYGASPGFSDYSRKDRDDFGNEIVVERVFSKRGSFVVNVAPGMFDQVYAQMVEYRARPIVFEASPQYGSTLVYGYVKDFSPVIEGPNHTTCSLQIEGLSQ
ncbi:hypothetical protein J2X45_003945 [Caulobacter sp. BE264]|uniref:hypothetical protein n=1 Tax=Caulobacter sp. BE264 TaxID=2817724 RepID=UPI002857E9E7|nr:hypothetical protein [Caulobacter sp. BE264]MDR7232835.1 hypothetical protein [Caulobacter sp. BE264]